MDDVICSIMGDFRRYWKKAFGAKTYEAWLNNIQKKDWDKAVLYGMHPDDREVMQAGSFKQAQSDNAALAFLNGFDYKKADKKARWEQCCKDKDASMLTPIPPHAYFGEASKRTKLVMLGINPQFNAEESARIEQQVYQSRKDVHESYRPWLSTERSEGISWHLSNIGDSDCLPSLCKLDLKTAVFQLEAIPYRAPDGTKYFDDRWSNSLTLESQKQAIRVLEALIHNNQNVVYFAYVGSYNYWVKMLKNSEVLNKEELRSFKDSVLVPKIYYEHGRKILRPPLSLRPERIRLRESRYPKESKEVHYGRIESEVIALIEKCWGTEKAELLKNYAKDKDLPIV